jgi:alkylated DNA repair dioxygenase AlkB
MDASERPLVIENFLTEAEEQKLLSEIDGTKWVSNRDNTRRVQISGPYHDSKYKMIPGKVSQHTDYVIELSKKVRDKVLPMFPNNASSQSTFSSWGTSDKMEVYTNEFLPGTSLAPHFDHRSTYEDIIVGISLSSDSKITFTKGFLKEKIDLPRRSLYVMFGPSRNIWKHSIEKNDVIGRRVSITFRTISSLK